MAFALKYPIGRDYFIKQVRGRVMKLTKGVYPAPLKIIDVSFIQYSIKFKHFNMLSVNLQLIFETVF